MKKLDRSGLLAAVSLKTETVTLSTGAVTLRELSADEYMSAYDHPLSKDEKGEYSGVRFTALMIARSAVDAHGKRLLTDEDAEALRTGGGAQFRKLGAAVNRLNGLTGEEIKN